MQNTIKPFNGTRPFHHYVACLSVSISSSLPPPHFLPSFLPLSLFIPRQTIGSLVPGHYTNRQTDGRADDAGVRPRRTSDLMLAGQEQRREKEGREGHQASRGDVAPPSLSLSLSLSLPAADHRFRPFLASSSLAGRAPPPA